MRRRSAVVAILLVGLLVAPVVAHDVVLCLGADGHVSLESARNGRCNTVSGTLAAPVVQITTVQAQTDHCGPCVDVAISTSHTAAQSTSLVQTLAPSMLALSPLCLSATVDVPPVSRLSTALPASYVALTPLLHLMTLLI